MSTNQRLRGRAATERRAAYLAMHPLCAHCLRLGQVAPAEELDHITSIERGGPDTIDNMQGLCKPCHVIKTNTERGHKVKPRIDLNGYPMEGVAE